jgi:hypothetical protein
MKSMSRVCPLHRTGGSSAAKLAKYRVVSPLLGLVRFANSSGSSENATGHATKRHWLRETSIQGINNGPLGLCGGRV